jgi:3-phenylpropionate/cinnamic acid dioxygenase small subunit
MKAGWICAAAMALAAAGCSNREESGADPGLAADRMAIENVMYDYVRGLDSGDMDVYLATLSDDAEFHAENADYEGKQAIADYVRPVMAARRESLESGKGMGASHHIVTNQALRFVDGEHAVMRSYWMFATKRGEGESVAISLMGSSEDSFVKQDGKWLIANRRVETL